MKLETTTSTIEILRIFDWSHPSALDDKLLKDVTETLVAIEHIFGSGTIDSR